MRPDQRLIQSAALLRAAHFEAWEAFIAALKERHSQKLAELGAADPDTIFKAQGGAQTLGALLTLLEDCHKYNQTMEAKRDGRTR